MSQLVTTFAAMVAEMRPQWDARLAQNDAACAAWVIGLGKSRGLKPAKPATVEDYRARLARYDSTAYLSDDRDVARAGAHERAVLSSMARHFDPDFAIWHEVVNGGVRK